jgi:predicted permease
MSRRQRAAYRLLSRVLPGEFRRRQGAELEGTAMDCLARERARFGRVGILIGWAGILVDLSTTAVALRWRSARRREHRATSLEPTSPLPTLSAAIGDVVREIRMPRLVRGHRGYALLTVTSLSLAVGATLVVFTVVNALWLKPVPFTEPGRLVMLFGSSAGEGDTYAFSEPIAARWRIFEAIAGQVVTSGDHAGQTAHLRFHAAGRDVETVGITPTYFSVLGQSIRGRDFTSHDNRPGAEPVAIISDRLWSRAFGRRDALIGALVPATPFPVRIIGIAPPGFEGARRGERTDVWVPAALAARLSPAAATTNPEGGSTLLVARLWPGQRPEAARRQFLERHAAEFGHHPDYVNSRQHWEALQVVRLADVFGTPSSRTIVVNEGRAASVVAGLAALVLLGSCATLMALVLVHYERRRRELSVRLALGASRLRLAAQLGLELGWLAAAGTGGAVVVALAALQMLPALSLPGGIDLGRLDLSLDWRVLGAAIGTTTFTLATGALVPLLQFTRGSLSGEVVAVPSTTPASSQRLRQALLAVHVSATIVVLVSAGLFVRAVVHGFTAGPGFDVDRTVSVRLRLPPLRATPDADIKAQLAAAWERTERLVGDLRALPGVDDVARGFMPIGLERMNDVRTTKTVEAGGEQRQLLVGTLRGGPALTAALGVPLLSGRALTQDDAAGRAAISPALITASLARTLWPTGDPVGQIVLINRGIRCQVVGVVGDVAYGSMSQPVAGVIIRVQEGAGIDQSFVVRTSRPGFTVEPIRRLIADMAPDAHRVTIATGREIVARDLGRQRLGAWFFSGFGLIALALGAGGVFGLVAYLAESRRREFGVRVALGATPRDLVGRGMAAGLVPVGLGAVAGLVASAIVSRLFVRALPGLNTLDPLTYASVALLMTACAAGAGLTAAWRLRTVAPADALRAE